MTKIWALLLALTSLTFAQTSNDETTVILGNNLQLQSFCGGTQIIINGQNIMAYTVVGHQANTGQTTLAFSPAPTGGNTLLVGVCFATGQTISGVSGSRNGTYTQAGSTYSSSDVNAQLAVYRFFNCAAGTETVTISGVAAANIFDIWCVEVNGLGSSPAVDVTATNQGLAAPLSVTLSPTAADFIFVIAGIGGGTTGTLTNLTLLDQVNDNDYWDATSGSGSITCQDSGITAWGALAVSFNTGGPTAKNATWKANPAVTLTESATRVAETNWSSNPKASLTETATRVALTTWSANPKVVFTPTGTRLALTTMTIQPKATLTMSELVTAPKTIVFSPKTTLAMTPMTIHNAVINITPQLRLALNATGGAAPATGDIPYVFWGGGHL